MWLRRLRRARHTVTPCARHDPDEIERARVEAERVRRIAERHAVELLRLADKLRPDARRNHLAARYDALLRGQDKGGVGHAGGG
jgi:hypothetical protein